MDIDINYQISFQFLYFKKIINKTLASKLYIMGAQISASFKYDALFI